MWLFWKGKKPRKGKRIIACYGKQEGEGNIVCEEQAQNRGGYSNDCIQDSISYPGEDTCRNTCIKKFIVHGTKKGGGKTSGNTCPCRYKKGSSKPAEHEPRNYI